MSSGGVPLEYRSRMDDFRQRIGWLRNRGQRQEGAGDDAPAIEDDEFAGGELVRDGDLVQLRRHVIANRSAFQRWYADEEIARLLRHDQRPLNHFQSRSYFESVMLPASAQGRAWGIHDRASGRLIGSCALTDFEGAGHRTAFFRILIGEKAWWGHGYGREATELTMREGFEKLALDEVKLEVFSTNERAIRAYAKVGFLQTGEHREWVGRDRFELHVLEMSLYRGEFEDGRLALGYTPAGDPSIQ